MNLSNLLPGAIALCSIVPFGTKAQIDSCNAFLKGNYIEVGVSPSGSYGSSTSTPAGYHSNGVGGSVFHPCGGTGAGLKHLGFLADPAMDGWSTGTPPFYGDYFLPGSPFEGWSLQVGTSLRADCWNTGGLPTGMTGSNVSYNATTTNVTSTWEGFYDSIKIKQVTNVPVNALYFTVKITLTNLSVLPKNNIYYMRSLDPDNDLQQPGGSFHTNNTIVHQMGDSAAVRAVAAAHPAASLTLGALDSNAECLIYSSWAPSSAIPLANAYAHSSAGLGSTQFNQGGTLNGDVAIGLIFKVPHIAPIDSATDSIGFKGGPKPHPANEAVFTYYYAFSPAAEDSAMAAIHADTMVTVIVTPPPVSNLGVQNVGRETLVKLYPNPMQGILNITGLDASDKVAVFDMMGKTFETGWTISTSGTNTFSSSSMPAGNYIIIVTNTSGNVKARIPLRKI